jgi:hypothetical protein
MSLTLQEQIELEHNKIVQPLDDIPNPNHYEIHDKALLNQLSSFQYLPVHFRGIITKEMGLIAGGTEIPNTPFHRLKAIAINPNELDEDRMQAVRYMCAIPYKDQLLHCIEAATSILETTTIDSYTRLHFFNNNLPYFKLNDHVVHACHPIWFKQCLKENSPFDCLLMSIKYILSQYPRDTTERFDVLDWVVDTIENSETYVRTKADLADTLVQCGDWDEASYGHEQLKCLGESELLFENKENVHSFTDSAKSVLRALYLDKTIHQNTKSNIACCLDAYQYFCCLAPTRQSCLDKVFFRINNDGTKFDLKTIQDCFGLVWKKIQSLPEPNHTTAKNRLLEECLDSVDICSSGLFTRIINSLQGLVEGKEFILECSILDQVRNAIYSLCNERLQQCNTEQLTDICESMISDDKAAAEFFMACNDPTDELWEETFKEKMGIDEYSVYKSMCETICNSYIGK